MQLQVMCNSILLTLEALLSLLKETKTIGKNLGKIRVCEGGELARGRSPSTQEEVAVDALLLTRELIAGGGLCRQRGKSRWEDQPQGKVICYDETDQRRSGYNSVPAKPGRRREGRRSRADLGVDKSSSTMNLSFGWRWWQRVVEKKDDGDVIALLSKECGRAMVEWWRMAAMVMIDGRYGGD